MSGQFDDAGHRIWAAGRGIDAVKRCAGRARSKCAGLPRKMPEEFASEAVIAGIKHMHFAKLPDLGGVQWVIRDFGAGEMAHHQRDAVIFGLRARRQRRRLFDRNAKPVHAGIDVECRAAAPIVGGKQRCPIPPTRSCC